MNKTPKFCIHCGFQIKVGEKFCSKCGAQLVKNLYDKTVIEPTEIEPTEVKPTNIEPTEIKPTEIKPTEIKPTEIKPTEIKPTEISPTEIKPTNIEPGVFPWIKRQIFYPNLFICGIMAFSSSLLLLITIMSSGFRWWCFLLLLAQLYSIFEVVFSIIKAPTTPTFKGQDPNNQNASTKFSNKLNNTFGIKEGVKPTPKNIATMVSSIIGVVLTTILLASTLFSGFHNLVVIKGAYRYSYASQGYNPETDYSLVVFKGGKQFEAMIYDKNELKFHATGKWWRIGKSCGGKAYTLVKGTWGYIGSSAEYGDTPNFEIIDSRTLLSGSCYYYKVD